MRAVLETIARARCLGSKRLANGAELIGHVPHVAPDAWLHIVFAPLDEAQLSQVERQIRRPLARDYAELLGHTNGLSLFADTLALDGLRTSYQRKGEAVRQPYAIETTNTVERPRDADPEAVFIGSYSEDGSLLYMDSAGKVHRSSRDSAKPLTTWPSLASFLTSETERLEALFDDSGRKVSASVSTLPPISIDR